MRKAIFLIALFAVSMQASSKELKPLSEVISSPHAEQSPQYPLLRCAALILGLIRYGGASYSDETLAQLNEWIDQLIVLGVSIRSVAAISDGATTVSREALASDSVEVVELITETYVKRLKSNFAREGAAWQNDDLINSDMEICFPLAQRITSEGER